MKILFATPRLPYPPDSGAKIRTLNLIKQAKNAGNQVVLLSFIYADKEKAGIKAIEDMGIDVITVKGKDSIDLFTIAKAFFYGLPLSVAKYRNKKMVSALKELINNRSIDLVHFDHIHMSQYIDYCNKAKTVIDEHNVESVILMRYAKKETNLFKKLILKNEYNKMARFEKAQCLKTSAVLAVSDEDGKNLQKLSSGKMPISVIPNGVDTEYFNPHNALRTTHYAIRNTQYALRTTHYAIRDTRDENSIIFTGSLDWLPNSDAVEYFCKDIFPLLLEERPNVKLYVVGKNPPVSLQDLAKDNKNIIVTGSVDDVRPFIEKSKVYVVPLRIGGGTRLKILEAFSMGKALVSTTIGAEGIDAEDGKHLLIADNPQDFKEKIIRLFNDSELNRKLGEEGKKLVKEKYDWNNIGKKLINVYKEVIRNGRQKG